MELSSLAHTWIFDVDGTLVKHNGYKIDGYDTLLDGVKEFFENLPKEDKVILLTARTFDHLDNLKIFLSENNELYEFNMSEKSPNECLENIMRVL